ADGDRSDRDRAEALGAGPALRDRREVLEDLAHPGHLAGLQGGLYPASVPEAASSDRALPDHAGIEQREDGGRARMDPRLRAVLPQALSPRPLGEVRGRLRGGGAAARSRRLARLTQHSRHGNGRGGRGVSRRSWERPLLLLLLLPPQLLAG